MVLSVDGTTADQEVVLEAVERETKGVVVSIVFRGGADAMVVVLAGSSDTVVSTMLTFVVVAVLQSVVEDVEAGVVVVAVWCRTDVGSSDTVVEEVVSLDGVAGRILSVVTGTNVVSGCTAGVVLPVAKGATGVADSVVSLTIGGDVHPISTGGEVLRGKEVVGAMPGKAAGIGLAVVRKSPSTVTGLVLDPVNAVVVVLAAVVLPVTTDVSEIGAGLEEVPVGAVAAEDVVAFMVSLVV